MKREGLLLLLSMTSVLFCSGQAGNDREGRLLFRGIVRDASTMSPLPKSQIFINSTFISASDTSGEFSFMVNRNDTVLFRLLGYKAARFFVSDTLSGSEFVAGVNLHTDTISIDEVIIVPKLSNLKSTILNAPIQVNPELENAKYNLAVAAYQGKVTTGNLGDPSANYQLLRQNLLQEASEKGGIPSDKMVGLSPFSVLPLAYLIFKGLPQSPPAMKQSLTKDEIDQINKKYLESARKKQ